VHTRHKGFTFIELLIVIIILGILSSVAIIRYVVLKQNAADATARGILGSLRSANSLLFVRRVADNTTGTFTMGAVVAQSQISGARIVRTRTNYVAIQIDRTQYRYNLNPIPNVPQIMGRITVSGRPTW
jgi:prepilin-type N-terminal cleavage/methylation domain-containing protein